MHTLILIASGAVLFGAFDFIVLGNVLATFYKSEIGNLARLVDGAFKPHPAGAIVYFVMALGVTLFVLPRVGTGNISQALMYGAAFGFVLGAVYDLTNYSVLANWSTRLVAVDILWITISVSLATVILMFIRDALL